MKSQSREKIESLIEKWGRHTSEDSIYWNSYETPHPLYALIDELVALIDEAKLEERKRIIKEIKNSYTPYTQVNLVLDTILININSK